MPYMPPTAIARPEAEPWEDATLQSFAQQGIFIITRDGSLITFYRWDDRDLATAIHLGISEVCVDFVED